MRRTRLWILALGALVVFALAGAAQAEKKPVKPSRTWTGSVADEGLMQNAPDFVASATALEQLWKRWGIAGDVPKVDFAKELVVLGTTRGSRIGLGAALDEQGDLQVVAISTKDLRPGFRYVLAGMSREGVKSVNGKDLPKQ